MKLPRVALFDIDGTLFDTERLWSEALSLLFEARGARQSPEVLMDVTYGLAWPDAFRALKRHFPDAVGDLNAQTLGHQLCLKFDLLFSLAPPVIPSAAALLRRLRAAGVPCGYVSGSPRRTIETNLTRCGLAGLFDSARSVPSDDMPRGKPFPDGYLLALERFGCRAEDAVAFEDSTVGSLAATEAGITTYVCPPPSAPAQPYPPAARRVPSWDDLFPSPGA